jgi:hypothetical protein
MKHPTAKRIIDLGKRAPTKARALLVDGICDYGVGNTDNLSKFPGAEIKPVDEALKLFSRHVAGDVPKFTSISTIHFHSQGSTGQVVGY